MAISRVLPVVPHTYLQSSYLHEVFPVCRLLFMHSSVIAVHASNGRQNGRRDKVWQDRHPPPPGLSNLPACQPANTSSATAAAPSSGSAPCRSCWNATAIFIGARCLPPFALTPPFDAETANRVYGCDHQVLDSPPVCPVLSSAATGQPWAGRRHARSRRP